jgi:hypothetical protein
MTRSLLHLPHALRSPANAFTAARLLVLATLLPLLLRLPLRRMLRILDWLNRWLVGRRPNPDVLRRYVDAMGRLHRWSFQDNCVVRSLCFYTLLNSPEAPLELRFGVEQREGPDGGLVPGRRHTWVMCGEESLFETEPVYKYLLLYRHPGARS